jgi:hypothetical protein
VLLLRSNSRADWRGELQVATGSEYDLKGRGRNAVIAGTFAGSRRFSKQLASQPSETSMIRIAAAITASILSVSAAAAQSTTPSGEKPETACTTSPTATTGSGEEKTANSMAIEKSAVLPDAGGSNSAAPTVQSGGKPLKVSPDCPPDSKPK